VTHQATQISREVSGSVAFTSSFKTSEMRVTHNFALYVNYEGQLRFLVCTAIRSATVKDVQYEMCESCLKSFKLSSGNPHYVKRH
jgi:hypothetical protein